MARFFIDRPVFAWVIAILIMMAGGISIFRLPVEQYPRIAPPVVTITAKYSGASAQTLEDTVAQVIEQKLNGIDGLLYINSTSDAAGQVSIRLTFDPDTNPDVAQMQVQNKLQLATSSLPEEVTRQGITVTKVADSFLQMYAFVSSDDSMSAADLCDFVGSTILDPLSRVDGVGEVSLFGAPYAMRIWLNPSKLLSYSLTPSDVINAVKAQNKQVSLGEVGGKPIRDGQQMNVTIKAQKQLTSVPEFERILLRVNPDGSAVRLRDVARVELGQESYTSSARYNGKPAAGVGIKLASDANALNTSNAVAAFIEGMRPYFPHGVEAVSPYDTVPFIKISIIEVIKTLLEAIVLVFAVIYLFLQNFRATIIPSLAVPVVLLGTFGVMAAFGFSINTLTMFGMVLAIGLLVDDAIVVVENVARVMEEDGLPPREATIKTMGQITGALIGVAAVLSAVFVPMAFFGGTVGAIYRQFSLTIVSAMILSVVVAVVLTPVLCSTFLKPGHMASQHGFFGWFNRSFDRATTAYRGAVGRIIKVGGRMMVIYLAMLVCAGWILWRMPTSFLPNEDQGILTVEIQLGPGSTETETLKIVEQVERHFLENEKENVRGMMLTLGRASGGKGQSTAQGNIRLRDWSERKDPERRAQAIIDRANRAFSSIINARIFVSAPPAIRSLGNATGFDFELQDQAGLGHEALIAARDQLMELARRSPLLRNVRTFGQDDSPQLEVSIDQEKAGAFGLALDAINADLSAAWGGKYVNDFVDRSRVKKVYVQADAPFRMKPEDFKRWYFRNDKGEMVPFTSIGEARWTYGPMQLERYNRADTGPRRRRDELGYGHAGDGTADEGASRRHRLPVDRDVLSGAPFRFAGAVPLCLVHLGGVPLPRRAVRELEHSAVGRSGRAPRRAWGCGGDRRARAVQRCVFPDRPAGDHRARGEERHSDRGVRAGVVPAGREPRGRRDGSGPVALAAHPHDLFSFPHRRIAAGDKYRGGVGKPECHRDRRHGRHVRSNGPWDFLCPGLFRLGLPPVQPEGSGRPGNRRSEGEALENPSGLTLAQQEVL